MYPLNHKLLKPKGPLRQLSFDDWNTLVNMLSGLAVEVVTEPTQVGSVPPAQDGHGWKIRVPASGAAPDELIIVTDVQFDGTQLQKKTRKVKVLFIEGEEESAWTTIVGGVAESCG